MAQAENTATAPSPLPRWRAGLEAAVLGLRDRLYSSRRFQRAAAAFPMTRPVARARAADLFDLCAGFVYSQVLLAAVETGALSSLTAGPVDEEDFARATGLPAPGARRLAKAGASLGLFSIRRDGRIGLGARGAALMGTPEVMAMIRHHRLLYRDLEDPVELLRDGRGGGALGRFWGYAGAGSEDRPLTEEAAAPYSDLMAGTQPFVAREVTAAVSFGGARRIMDVGGGNGAFLRAVGDAAPGTDLVLFDLPAVADAARSHPDNARLGARLMVRGGSFLHDPLPEGADVITLVRILHDHDTPAVRAILSRVRAALRPGGRLVIAEPMADTPGARPMGHAYFGLYLWAMGSGEPRSKRDLTQLLRAAGFDRVREAKTRQPLLARVLVGT